MSSREILIAASFGKIISFGVPPALRSGDPVAMTVLVRNIGVSYASFYTDLWDAETGARLWQSSKLGLGPGEQVGFYVIEAEAPVMPNRALELIVQTHHNGEIDDMQQKRIRLEITELPPEMPPPPLPFGLAWWQLGLIALAVIGGVGAIYTLGRKR